MVVLPFKPDRKLTDVLAESHFTCSAEVIPPRNGSEQRKLLEQIERLIGAGAQFLAVTKGAGGSLRGGSLPIAQAIKESFNVPCIAHFTCRDLTAPEVENQLIDHHYFGIRNILALRGDPPDGQSEWHAREGGYNFAYELIQQIAKLNHGLYLPRANGPERDGNETTDFCIGAAAYPEFPDPEKRIEHFRIKAEAGAQFGITDMLFQPELYAEFTEKCASHGVRIPILPGTRILKSQEQALKMAAKFRVTVPKEVLAKLPEKSSHPDALRYGVEVFLTLVERLRALGAPGIHLFVIADTEGAVSALTQLAEQPKEVKN